MFNDSMLLFCFQIIVLAKVIIDVDYITLSARGVTILVDSLYSVQSTTIVLTGKKPIVFHIILFSIFFCNLSNNKYNNKPDTLSHDVKKESPRDNVSLLCTPNRSRVTLNMAFLIS